MSEPLPSAETPVARPVEMLRYTILTALLYLVGIILLSTQGKSAPNSAVFTACSTVVWVWLLLIRPALDILDGKLSARKELLFGAYLTLATFCVFVALGFISLIHGSPEPDSTVPETVVKILVDAATVLATLQLRREITKLPPEPR